MWISATAFVCSQVMTFFLVLHAKWSHSDLCLCCLLCLLQQDLSCRYWTFWLGTVDFRVSIGIEVWLGICCPGLWVR
jgi:hypothetical protein